MEINGALTYGILSLLSGIISAVIAVYLAPFWRKFGARQLMLLTAASAVWSMAYAMELLSPAFSVKLFWVCMEYVGSAWIAMLIFKFILSITGRTRWLTPPVNLLLCMVPAATLVLVFTNDLHGLMWQHAWTQRMSGIEALFYHRGIGFWIFLIFSYALLFWAALILIQAVFVAFRDHFRRQLKIILLGIVIPWACNVVYIFDFDVLQGIDLTPFAFMITGLIFAWAMVRYQLLYLIPLAHEAVMDSMGDPVVVLDMEDRVVELNQASTRLFEVSNFVPGMYKARELFFDLSDLVDRHRGHTPVFFEAEFAAKGNPCHWHIFISPLLGTKRIQKGWLIVCRDITEQKLTEIALRQARDYVKSIINSMPSILIGVDDKAVVTQWNLEAQKMTGISADKARKRFLPAVFPQGSGIVPDILAAIETRKVHKKEKTILVLNDQTCVTDITIYPILSDSPPGAVIRVDDISERAKIEEMMVHSEKMISVGGLAAGMAHEINNPLAGMLQIIQVIQNRLSKPLPANIAAAERHNLDLDRINAYMTERQIFDLMDQAIAVGKRAAAIVQNMLSFSRRSESRRSSHFLSEMMDATLDLVKNDFNLKKRYDILSVDIATRVEAQLPPVPCEKTKIQQVFFNILKNGVEAMSEAKTCHPSFVIRYFRERDMAGVEIRDNGPGIPQDIRKRIFEPFFTTKEVGIGTGLGLSVSYFIITENHGGQLTVTSAPGSGTAFIVKLPLS